jgi:undecaprenyl-diphosphatase
MFNFDQPFFRFLFGLTGRSAWLDGLFSFLGNGLAYLLGAFFLFYLFKEKGFKNKVHSFSLAAVSAIISRGIIATLMYSLIVSPRPFVALSLTPLFNHPASNSFPSGHMAFFLPLGLTILEKNRKAGLVLIFLTILMGFGRVISGVHWISDIAAGLIVGAVSFYSVRWALKHFSLA